MRPIHRCRHCYQRIGRGQRFVRSGLFFGKPDYHQTIVGCMDANRRWFRRAMQDENPRQLAHAAHMIRIGRVGA